MAHTRSDGKTSTVGTGEVPAVSATVPAEDVIEDEDDDEDGSSEDVSFDDDEPAEDPDPAVEHRAGRSRRVVAIAAIALLVLGIVIGYAAGRFGPLFTAPGDDSAEAGFARDMTVHHGQAVHMAMVEYDRGQDSTLRRMAYDIATSQEYQIGVMEGWLREWRLALTTDRAPMAWVPKGENV